MTTIIIDRATVEQALETLERARPLKADYTTLEYFEEAKRKHYAAMAALRAALAQQAEPVPTHRINSWGFCGVCRHDRIPGEGCARQECPDSPQQAEPVKPVALKHRHEWFRTGGMEPGQFRCIHCGVWGQEQPDPQIEDRLARHGIPMPGDPK